MKYLVLSVLIFCSFFTKAQKRNIIKVNLASPISNIWSVQYELELTKHLSFNNTLFYRPKSSIPFATQVDQIAKSRGLGITGVDFTYIFIDKSRIGIKGYSPELRYYFGQKKNPWFAGIFAQFETFDMTVPASFPVRYQGFIAEVEIPVDFDIVTRSGGILIGKKINFNRFSLDVVIVGPHLGRANKVDAQMIEPLLAKLSTDEQAFLKEKVVERFRLDESYFNVGVGSENARINAKRNVPYLGIRGFGLNLGYRF